MEIPPGEFWAAVGTLIVAAVVYAFATTKTLGKCLTRTEHEKICEGRNKQIDEKLKEIHSEQKDIKRHLERQDTESNSYRHDMRDSLHAVRLSLAVVRTKVGLPVPEERNERG